MYKQDLLCQLWTLNTLYHVVPRDRVEGEPH